MRTLLATCLWAVALALPAQAEFVEVTPPNLDVGGWGAAWGDYDNDMDFDLFITRSGEDMLFRNDGGLAFENVAQPPLADMLRSSTAAWADFDNDGDNDLFVGNAGSYSNPYPLPNLLARNDGNAVFVDVTGTAGEDSLATPTMGGFLWGDFDGDGDLDLYLVDAFEEATNRMFRNDGNAAFELIPAGDASLKGPNLYPSAADFDNDGDLDIYSPMLGAPNRLLRNDGVFGFFDVAPQWGVDDAGDSWGCAWGDYDNDEDLDLFLTSGPSGEHRLFRNDGGGFADVTQIAGIASEAYPGSASWADCDNDGFLDLIVMNYGDFNRLYSNDGDGTFTDIATPPLQLAWYTASSAGADFDCDGDGDVFYHDGSAGNYHCHLLEWKSPRFNHWLHVRLIGNPDLPPPYSNRSAIGARVRVVADVDGVPPAETQIREVRAQAGGGTLLVEFGLGLATSIDLIEVRWPSGRVQVETDVPWLDQTIAWLEGAASTAVEARAQPAQTLRLHQNYPNPFNPSTTIRYDLSVPSAVRIRIFDVNGRLVRTVQDLSHVTCGEHAARWDGRDDGRRAVSSGIYYYRIEAGEWTRTRPMVLVR
jgi:hypothetical protein